MFVFAFYDEVTESGFVTTLKTVRKSDVTTYKNTQRTKQTI